MRSIALPATLLVSIALIAVGPGAAARVTRESRDREPRAGTWQPYVLSSGAAIDVAEPPSRRSDETKTELATLETYQAAREASPAIQSAIAKWDARPAFAPWTQKTLSLIAANATSTAKAQRVMALVHVAMYDATVAAWNWKYTYRRKAPAKFDDALSPAVETTDEPTYPSEHAVLAGAAATVLKAIYPADATIAADEQEAAGSRLYAGTNYPSDVAAGLALGAAVAQQVLAVASSDNLGAGQPGRLPAAGCELTATGCMDFWEPTFPRSPPASPTDPFAGTWHTWVIASTGEVPAPPPPWYVAGPAPSVDVTTLTAAAQVDFEAVQRTVAQTPEGAERRAVVDTWAGIPDKHWNELALALEQEEGLNLPRAIRISALVNAAGADAIEVNWATKFLYWEPRPQQVVRKYIDPAFVSYRPTPNEPAYTSGLATVSGAISGVLMFFFPEEQATLERAAADAEISRLYDGTHYEHDIAAGAAIGQSMVPDFIERARSDGARPPR
jgi:membrane-associated phospholipid phosphatase